MTRLSLTPWLICCLVVADVAPAAAFQKAATSAKGRATRTSDPLAALDEAMAAAERSLRDEELQIAESRYRSALQHGWMLLGAVEIADGRPAGAREAFRHASTAAVEADAALQSLALVHLQMGEADEAVRILSRLAGMHSGNPQLRRLLAQALFLSRRPQEAVQELEEARGVAPQDPELAFALATAYLAVKRVEAAVRLFGEVGRARPIPQTYVLIGRTYRDFDQFDRARSALRTALERDPRVRRAHYYLGTVALMEGGVVRLDEAIAEFQQELKLAPDDHVTNLRLGMALVEARQPAAALPRLQVAARSDVAPAEASYYLGRCQLALGRASEAVAHLRRALALTEARGTGDESRIAKIHYQLALALRQLGAAGEAATHFAAAQRASANETELAREALTRYFAEGAEPRAFGDAVPIAEPSPFSALPASQREALARRVKSTLARAYLNLGVMHAQAQRFPRAAEFFEQAAEADANFPQVQYSLGVAYFNAKRYDKAATPLARALASDPDRADARRMLALSWLNMEAYDKAADLLKDDPRRDTDPALQYAYGLALVRSNRAEEAEQIFSRLLAAHGQSPELSVVLGQAHAQQGDFGPAVGALQRALQLRPDVPDANATLGIIYLKQGRLAEAETALRAELAIRPDDLQSQYNLATVLDLQGRSADALTLVRAVLKARPDFADARYLLGKMLLVQGRAAEAAEQLEAAVRLAPEEANIHYQLAQAYTKLGRTDAARQHFDRYQQLKDKRRGKTP